MYTTVHCQDVCIFEYVMYDTVCTIEDPDIRLGGGSTDTHIRLRGQFNMFPSTSRVFLPWRSKSIAKLNGDHGRISLWLSNCWRLCYTRLDCFVCNVLTALYSLLHCVLYCIWPFIKHFSQNEPFKNAFSARNPKRKDSFWGESSAFL